MKRAATIFLSFLASGAANTAISAASHADIKPIDSIRLKFEAFNQHDADAIEKIYASSATLRSPDYPYLVGNKQIADTYRRLFDAIPDAKDNLEILENSSSHVYAQFVLTGHLKGAEDKPISVRIISVYAVKDGHIVDDSTYYDRKMP
jgi:hypothetical protein